MEPRLTATLIIRSPCYYGQFFSARQNGHTFPYKKNCWCGHPLIDLSRVPVNKGTNSRLGWTKCSDLYEIVHPSLVFISLCLLTEAYGGKGLYGQRPHFKIPNSNYPGNKAIRSKFRKLKCLWHVNFIDLVI